MLGVQRTCEPATVAVAPTSPDQEQEAAALNTYLQNQLQEDIARIYDESLYSDLEIVFGRNKILTHSCFLKTRTGRFFKRLEGILHIDIDRNTFEEIDSFVSDIYTECNIKQQEDEIIDFLDKSHNNGEHAKQNGKASIDHDVFLTPRCHTPCSPCKSPVNPVSPCIDLKREFYELVPVEPNLLDKELIEQDELLSGLKSIISLQEAEEDTKFSKIKPTSLSLRSSHTSKIVKHSSSCDKLVKNEKPIISRNINTSCNRRPLFKVIHSWNSSTENPHIGTNGDSLEFKLITQAPTSQSEQIPVRSVTEENNSFSPDSLAGDDPSSSSDFLSASAAYSCTPLVSSANLPSLAGQRDRKMENIVTTSDSGMESSGFLESTSSHHDTTVSDSSFIDLTESTLQDDIPPEDTRCARLIQEYLPSENNSGSRSSVSMSNSSPLPNLCHINPVKINEHNNSSCADSTSSELFARRDRRDTYQSSSKEEKQRLNEEIVTMESSSLSSETGSWESVFPLKIAEAKESCVKFIQNERKYFGNGIMVNHDTEELMLASINSVSLPTGACPSLVQSAPYKVTSCFIDAASLLDDDPTEANCRSNIFTTEAPDVQVTCTVPSSPGQQDDSEILDIEDSLQQGGKDLSPATMDTTPITEDSLLCDAKPDQDEDPLQTSTYSWTVNMNNHIAKSENVLNGTNDSRNTNDSEKSSQKFFIDLSSLPEPSVVGEEEQKSEKKNIFSLFISLGDNTNVKEGPTMSSSRYIKPVQKSKNTLCTREKPNGDKNDDKAMKNMPKQLKKSIQSSNSKQISPRLSCSEMATVNTSTNMSAKSDESIEVLPTRHSSSDLTKLKKEFPPKRKPEDARSKDAGEFVRLSDLDRPSPKLEMETLKEGVVYDVRMTRSLPQDNRAEQQFFSSLHSENAKSLNRLFPHLKNELSRSIGEDTTCTSETSQSNNDVSTPEFNTQLGQDLLRMFKEEIASDVTIEVSGRRLRAHKCILSSRCQYFAGVLSGGFVQSAGNVITLSGFSYNVVHFALCHIYSGEATIPESISIMELVALADMLELEGLKEVIMFTLKIKYCHNFHKPCEVCSVGVLECLTLTSAYGLEEIYQRSLKWTTKHFVRIWPTKAFATLPKELVEKCYQQHLHNMNVKNVVDTVLGCGKICTSLHSARWAEVVKKVCRLVVNAAAQFAAYHMVGVLGTVVAARPSLDHATEQVLDAWMMKAIEWGAAEHIIQAYQFLAKSVDESDWSLMKRWQCACEDTLLRTPPQSLRAGFRVLSPELKLRLKERGYIYMETHASVAQTPKRSLSSPKPYLNNVRVRSHHSSSIDRLRKEFVPYAAKPVAPRVSSYETRSCQYLSAPRRVEPPKVQITKTSQQRVKLNAAEREPEQKTPSRKSQLSGVKSRYLEPRESKRDGSMGSSSETSRKSSPKLGHASAVATGSSRFYTRRPGEPRGRASLPGRASHSGRAQSHDSLALSTELSKDSLSESLSTDKFATYTKSKNGPYTSTTAQTKYPNTKIPVPTKRHSPLSKTLLADVKTLASPSTSSASVSSQCVGDKSTRTKMPAMNGSPCHQPTRLYASKPAAVIQPSAEAHQLKHPNACKQKIDLKVRASVQTVQQPKTRKLGASLMCATKSSSAKIVVKVSKEVSTANKPKTITGDGKKDNNDLKGLPEKPVMERSGTFLKDELSFTGLSVNID